MKQFTTSTMLRTMRLSLLPAILIYFFIPLHLYAEVVDKVVAVVNEDIITLSELEAEASTIYQTIARTKEGQSMLSAMDEAREATLNSMIDQHLIQQRARLFNVAVSEEEIDQAYNRMVAKNKLNASEFRRKLLQSGLSEENYRSKLRSSILQSKLLSIDVRSKIVITDAMILDYYDEHYTSRVAGDSYYLLQMGFSWNSELTDSAKLAQSKNEALDTAKRIKALAVTGKNFKTLAQKFSDLPSASDGGDIGTFTLDEMAIAMRSAVENLPPGEISKIIETPAGYQFFKLLSGDENAIVVTSSYEAAEDEIREKLYNEKLKDAYQDWVKLLKEEAYIQKL